MWEECDYRRVHVCVNLNLPSAGRYFIYKYSKTIILVLLGLTKSKQEKEIVTKKDCYVKWEVNPQLP